ncbi:MAG: hypothetical protein KGI36_12630, partial [Burkholderiales bacterium]|nr:hypothetical protein [Burkholderiales bacterium]
EADSDCADAHALAAEAHVALAGLTSVPSRPELERARAAARRALELDADSAAAHGVLGQIALLVDHDWPHAEARLLAGLRCAPGVAASHARYGWALTLNGRHAEARAAYLEARDLDPLSLLYRAHEALIAIYERDWPLAATGLDDVLATAPEHLVARVLRAALHLYAGEIEAGRIGFEALDAAHPGLSIGACGIAQARALAGDTCGAEQLLTGLLERERAGWVSPYQIAMVLARMGRLEAAVEQLERAATAADFNFACVGVDPAFDDLRADAAGAALLRRHGFGHLVPARVLR